MATVAERIITVAANRMSNLLMLNGYAFNAAVRRGVRQGTGSPTNHTIYVSVDSLTPNEALSYMGNPPVMGWDLVVRCSCVVTPSEGSQRPADEWRLEAYDAMSRAMTSPADWYAFKEPDGTRLSVDAVIEAPEMQLNAEQGQVGAHLLTRVKFRVSELSPSTVRS